MSVVNRKRSCTSRYAARLPRRRGSTTLRLTPTGTVSVRSCARRTFRRARNQYVRDAHPRSVRYRAESVGALATASRQFCGPLVASGRSGRTSPIFRPRATHVARHSRARPDGSLQLAHAPVSRSTLRSQRVAFTPSPNPCDAHPTMRSLPYSTSLVASGCPS